jgi:hypothetical protein
MNCLYASRCSIRFFLDAGSSPSEICRPFSRSATPAGSHLPKGPLFRRIRQFTLICLVSTFLACTGAHPVDRAPLLKLAVSDIDPQDISGQQSQDGLVQISPPDARSWRFYIKERSHLKDYDKVIIDRITIGYRSGVDGWKHRDERKIRVRLRKALKRSLANGDYWELTDEVDERTLIARISILDLVVDPRRRRAGFESTSRVSFVKADGNASVAFELFDATSGDPILRFVERYRLPAGAFSSRDIEAQRLGLVLRAFARRMGDRMESRYRIVRNLERQKLLDAVANVPRWPVDSYGGGDSAIPAIPAILSKLPDAEALVESLNTVPPVPMSAFVI